MKKLLVLMGWEKEYQPRLKNTAQNWEIIFDSERQLSKESRKDVEIIFGNPDAATLAEYPSLKWIQLGSAGADAYLSPGVLPSGVVLTNASGAYGHAIGEYLVGTTFSLYKNLHRYRDQQQNGCWEDCGAVKSISGAHVLVVGLGDIGSEFAWRMTALGAHVTGICRTYREKPAFVEALYQMDALDQLLPTMDIVSLSLPNTAETKGLFSRERIGRMKQGSILLNVGRGTAIDTEALCDALESGHLGGAALDVTEPEPLPEGHRLWHTSNAIITPHVSGGYHLRETYETILNICLDNLGRYRAGLPLQNQISLSSGYRER